MQFYSPDGANAFKIKYNDSTVNKLVDTLVELAFASPANTCIIPMQDLLCQDGTTRMNLPSTVSTDNWSYRVLQGQITDGILNFTVNYDGFVLKTEDKTFMNDYRVLTRMKR